MYLSKETLYKKIANCRAMLHSYNICDQITITKICNTFDNIDISYVPFKTHGLRGMVSLASNEEPINCILINSNIPETEQNFHALHEFMHIYLHPNTECQTFKCYDRVRDNQNFTLEWQANEGAAELIMPYKEFIPLFCDLYEVYSNKSDLWNVVYGKTTEISYLLSKRYNVSGKVIENRISSLSYEIDQYRQGTSIDKIKLLSYSKRILFGISTTDYIGKLKQFAFQHYSSLCWDAIIN